MGMQHTSKKIAPSVVPAAGERPVGFMFPGQGAQHAGMGRGLYASEPAFRTQVDRCSQLLSSRLDCELRRLLYPAAGEKHDAARWLGEMRISQTALFAVEYALARMWMEWGVMPRALIGHSLGELVAACLAGVFSLEEGLGMVAERGRLMQATAAGGMLSVSLPEAEIAPLLGPELALSAFNAPNLCAVSGPVAALAALERRLARQGVECRRLRVAAATHSRLMEPVVKPLVAEVAKLRLRPPRIPLISNVTGRRIRDREATDPDFWGRRHLCQPVRFTAGLSALAEAADGVLLEVGPGQTLTSLTRRHRAAAGRPVLASMRHPRDPGSDAAFLLNQVGQLWREGVAIDPRRSYAGCRPELAERPGPGERGCCPEEMEMEMKMEMEMEMEMEMKMGWQGQTTPVVARTASRWIRCLGLGA